MDCAKKTAEETGGKSIALTFSIDPDELFAADKLVKLMSNEQRIAMLASTGVDVVAVLPFNREFAKLSPYEFLDWAFGSGAPAHIHVGDGFRFGARGLGTAQIMREWRGGVMQVHEHPLVQYDGKAVSATRVRGLLAKGEFATARSLLGIESFSRVHPIRCA